MDIKQNIPSNFNSNKRLAYLLPQTWSANGRLRKTSFLHGLASKGLLRLNDSIIISETSLLQFGNEIDSMITILNRMYEDKWDFHLLPIMNGNKLDYYMLYVKIIFPDITITNTRNESHNIKNLVVTFKLKKSDSYLAATMCPSELEGTRAFMTFKEWFVGYNHSHLPSYKPGGFDKVLLTSAFCTGSDTEIVNTMTELNIDGYTEEQFELFLYCLNTVTEYESIEGVPFISMNKVGPINENTHQPTMNPNKTRLGNGYTHIQSAMNFENANLKYHYNDNRFKVKLNNEFDEFVKNAISQAGNTDYIKDFIIRKINNVHYGFTIPVINSDDVIGVNDVTTQNPINAFKKNGELAYTMIQGKKINFNITEYSGELPEIKDYKTHPKFLEYVAEQLEQQLYYKAVRKSTVERQHQGSNA